MRVYKCEADERGHEFLDEVTDMLIELFGISEEEALGRVNRQFGNEYLVGDDILDIIVYHETPDYWANRIYYGRDSNWWLKTKEELTPVAFP